MRNAILIAFDDKYFPYAKSCLKSIEYNYPTHPEILVFYLGRSANVTKFLETISNTKIITCNKEIIKLDGINLGVINSEIVYSRYILWTSFFDDYDTIIHLDVDTIILKPFEELFLKETFFGVYDFKSFLSKPGINRRFLQFDN